MIQLNKKLTPEALEAMSRNTIVQGGAIDNDVMSEFERLLKERLDKVPGGALKKAIGDSVRETATKSLLNAKEAQVKKIVDKSFNDILESMGMRAPEPPREPPAFAPPPRRSSFGGK
jgi:hypothetical protein